MAQVVEYPPSKHKALNANPSTIPPTKKKELVQSCTQTMGWPLTSRAVLPSRIFWNAGNMAVTNHMRQLSNSNVASMTEELSFNFDLIVIK
jgi:hypothetical protein